MIALAELRSLACSGCGNDISETSATDQWDRPVHKYVPPSPQRCWSCDALELAREKTGDTKRSRALLWPRPIRYSD